MEEEVGEVKITAVEKYFGMLDETSTVITRFGLLEALWSYKSLTWKHYIQKNLKI